jgi:hypothetical protein
MEPSNIYGTQWFRKPVCFTDDDLHLCILQHGTSRYVCSWDLKTPRATCGTRPNKGVQTVLSEQSSNEYWNSSHAKLRPPIGRAAKLILLSSPGRTEIALLGRQRQILIISLSSSTPPTIFILVQGFDATASQGHTHPFISSPNTQSEYCGNNDA